MISPGSSAAVSTGAKVSRAASTADQKSADRAVSPRRSAPTASTRSNAGSCGRIASTFGRFTASVISARAPLSASRNSSASSPNSVNRGIEIRPAFHAAMWETAASTDCDMRMPTRSPRSRPLPTRTLANRLDSCCSARKVYSTVWPSSSSTIRATASGRLRACLSQTSTPMLKRSGICQLMSRQTSS